MEIIYNNPFRLVGVKPTDSDKDILKQLTKITRFSEVGKDISFETDLPHLGEIIRSKENINQAKRNLEKPQDKLFHSLFWFNIENHIDETGFESLKNNNEDKALEIWRKVVKDGKVSPKNYSTLSNLKSILLMLSFQKKFNKDYFIEGMNLSGFFFSNPEFKNYCKNIISDETSLDLTAIQTRFLDSLQLKVKSNKISIKEFMDSIESFPNSIKENYRDKVSNSPINKIENEVTNIAKLRDENPTESLQYAQSLLGLVGDLDSLANITGRSDVKYQLIADKFAKEILECIISFYNNKTNTGVVIKEEADLLSELLEISGEIASGEQLKKRIEENKEVIIDSTKDSPPGSKITKEIEALYSFIKDKIYEAAKDLNSYTITRFTCIQLMEDCKEKLQELAEKIGPDDEFYINICSQFVQVQIAMQIDYLNRHMTHSNLERTHIQLFESLSVFAMDSETRSRYNTNKNILKRNYSQSSGGCYIATMAYGDYNHPNVLELRNFRDNYLQKSIIGKMFIKFYYKYSPTAVELLKNKKTVNLLIRSILDKFVVTLKHS